MTAPYRRTVARCFEFAPEDRAGHTFSTPSIRLDAGACALQLKATAGKYPTTGEHYVLLPAFSPDAVRQWRGVDVVCSTPKSSTGAAVTAVTYRLGNGAALYWWSGTAWAVATTGQWNTLAEVQAHIAAFPVTAHTLVLAVRLATTDATLAPSVSRLVVVFDADVPSFTEEVIYRTLVRELAKVRVVVDLVVRWAATGTTYTLDIAGLEEPPGDVVDVVGAYNHFTDPGQTTDLLASYNTGTRVVTLASSVAAGTQVRLCLLAKPVVAVATHPDYDEIAKLPAVVVDSVDEQFAGDTGATEAVVDRTTLGAIAVASPVQARYEVGLRIVAARSLDLQRLCEAVQTFIRRSPVIVSPALDSQISVVQVSPPSMRSRSTAAHVQEATLVVRLATVERWERLARGAADGAYGAGQLNLSGTLEA